MPHRPSVPAASGIEREESTDPSADEPLAAEAADLDVRLAADQAADPPTSGESLGRSSARGFLWSTLAWGSNRLVVLGLTLVLARLLVPSDFGVVTAALTVIAMLDAALDLGVGAAVVTEQESGVTERIRTAMSVNIAMSTTVAIIGIACSAALAELFHSPGQTGLFALVFLYPFFRGFGQISDALLKRDLRFRRRTVVDLSRAAVRVAVSIPLALAIGGPVSIAAGMVGAELVAAVMLLAFSPVRPTAVLRRSVTLELLRFGGQVTVIRILGSFRSSFDYVVVGAGIGTAALGLYGMAYKLPELLIENVLWIFAAVALPTYSRARAAGPEALVSAMVRATRLLTMFGLVTGVLLAVVARDAMPVLFSQRWTPAVQPMMLIALSLGIMAVAWASGDVFSAMGRPGVLLALDVPATLLMAIAFVWSTRYGLIGVACVHLLFNVLYAVARFALTVRVTGVGARRLGGAVLPGALVALLTAAAGSTASALLPAGSLLSLVVLSALCVATAVLAALGLARTTVADVLHLLPIRRRASAAPRPA